MLHQVVEKLSSVQARHPDTDVLLAGDFNARHSSWCTRTNSNGRVLHSIADRCLLSVCNPVRVPTFFNTRGGKSTIDLFLSSSPGFVSEVNVLPDDCGSDHAVLQAVLHVDPVAVQPVSRQILNIRSADWDKVNAHVRAALQNEELRQINNLRRDGVWQDSIPARLQSVACIFTDAVQVALREHVGYRQVQTTTSTHPFWWSPDIQRLVNKKAFALRELRSGFGDRRTLQRKYDILTQKLARKSKGARVRSWQKFCSNHSSRAKIFKLHAKSKGRFAIPSYINDITGDFCATPAQKALAHNQVMQQISDGLPSNTPEHVVRSVVEECKSLRLDPAWNNIDQAKQHFSLLAVKRILAARMSGKSAPGIDNVNNEVLNNLDDTVLSHLSTLLLNMYACGLFPDVWKTAVLTPIPKGKPVECASDLRPISLLSCIGKLYERLVHPYVVEVTTSLGAVPSMQAGFQSGRSTHEHLASTTDFLRSMSSKEACIGFFLDISKAYNTVWHDRLMLRLQELRFPRDICTFINSWLRQRKHVARVDGATSPPCVHDNGVPQGSVLSPLLFNIFFSRILKDCTGLRLLYADDGAVLIRCQANSVPAALSTMESNTNKIFEWCLRNGLTLNAQKSSLVVFSRNRKVALKSQAGDYSIVINGERVSSTSIVRCLGVEFQSNLQFDVHCQKLLQRMRSRCSTTSSLGAYSWGCPPKFMLLLYKSVVLPAVLYCPWVWLMASSRHVRSFSRIQRGFIRRTLSLPKCASGLAAEVYAALRPARLCIHERTMLTLQRLAYKNPDYNARLVAHATSREAATSTGFSRFNATLPKTHLHLINMYGVPFYATPTARPVVLPLPPPPSMPTLQKKKSSFHLQRAKNFGYLQIQAAASNAIQVYTDGCSVLSERVGGSAVYATFPDGSFTARQKRISGSVSAWLAELVAIDMALDLMSTTSLPAVLFVDSQAAIRSTYNMSCVHPTVIRCRRKLSQIRLRCHISWIPSHVGLDGNECVDTLASDAATDPDYNGEESMAQIFYEDVQRIIKNRIYAHKNKQWIDSDYAPYLHAVFPTAPVNTKHTLGDSSTSRQIARLRCGYVSCNSYLHRHGLAPSDDCQYCLINTHEHVIDSVQHAFIDCPEHEFYSHDLVQSCSEILGDQVDFSLLHILRIQSLSTSATLRLHNAISLHVRRITDYSCF